MKNTLIKTIFLAVFVTVGSGFLIGCPTKNQQNPPFFDGMFLEYEFKFSSGASGDKVMWNYKVISIDDQIFRLEKTTTRNGKIEEDWGEFLVDSHGQLVGKNRTGIGKFSEIWLPAKNIYVGHKIGGNFSVTKIERWKTWDVYVIEHSGGQHKYYFDATTGFLVGSTLRTPSGVLETFLGNTNADIEVRSTQLTN